MKTRLLTTLLILTGLLSCMEPSETAENKNIQRDTIQRDFIFTESKDSVIQNGEYIKYYKNGVIEMRGMMKDGKREGLWKSWYEDGSPWSETTFKEGKKNGKTTTWYGNNNKRYEGFYANDIEAGRWTFWAENGKIQSTQNY
jgi:antitoxin component YwqK of YwqJK toxin-antitoxin module